MHGQLFATSLEDKERVEVMTGLSSFLYGPSNVGGMVNFINKRPTYTPFYSITTGDYGGGSVYVHGDFGGPLYKDKVAYRLNVVEQDGATNVDHQSIKRNLLSGALDWRVTDGLLLQFDGYHDENSIDGNAAFWSFATNPNGSAKAFHPSAPDASRNWGQEFTQSYLSTDKGETRLTWDLNGVVTLRSAYRYSIDDQNPNIYANNSVTSNNGEIYSQTIFKNTEEYYTSKAGYTLLDAKFKIGFLENKLTTGYTGDRFVMQLRAPITITPLPAQQP